MNPDRSASYAISDNISYTPEVLSGERWRALVSTLPDEVPEIPLNVFISHLLPKVGISAENLKEVQFAVHETLYDTNRGQWSMADLTEFGKLQTEIVDIAKKMLCRNPTVDFRSGKVQERDWRYCDTTPDGGVSLKRTGVPHLHLKNTCRVDEYKVHENEEDEEDIRLAEPFDFLEVGKVILSMHRVLSHDISRRFTFGLTVEDQDVRMYFACRAFFVVSEEFNINENWKDFVRITLAFGFATDEQLGWDNTIKIHPDGFHTISVCGTEYKVTKKALMADLEKADLAITKEWFFTHKCHEDVRTCNGEVDSTATFSQDVDGRDLYFEAFSSRTILKQSIGDIQIGILSSRASWVHRNLNACNVYSLNGKLKLGGLGYAKKFGEETDVDAHDRLIGNQGFRSTEIESARYSHARTPIIDPELAQHMPDHLNPVDVAEKLPGVAVVKELNKVLRDGHAETTLRTARVEPVIGHQLPLTHNPLHDLESIYWLLVYILGIRRPLNPSPGWKPFAQRKAMQQAFPAVYTHQRPLFFFHREELRRLTDTFDSIISEDCFSGLDQFRNAILVAQFLAEEPLPEPLNLKVLNYPFIFSLKRAIMCLWNDNWPVMELWPVAKADDG